MSFAHQKKPYRNSRYGSAEDLCDPLEHADRAGTADAPQKPRRHAVRLMDELTAEVPMPGGAERGKAPDKAFGKVSDEMPALRPQRRHDGECVNGYAIRSIKPSGEGATVAVVLTLPADSPLLPEDDTAQPRRVRLHLLVEQYTALGLQEGSITAEAAQALIDAGRLCDAVMRGIRLLQYGDRSARRLSFRLTAKGIDRETADAAAAYLVKKGYIHEDDTARLRAEANVRKLWGPRRIREDLRANGFTSEAVAEAMASIADVDFEDSCAALIRKRYCPLPTDRAGTQKLAAALMRQGYDLDTIRAARLRVERGE